jgi:hypothetical protein
MMGILFLCFLAFPPLPRLLFALDLPHMPVAVAVAGLG